jgi:hypothetical protein
MQVFFLAESADTPGWGPKYYTTPTSNLSRENVKIFLIIFFHKSIDNPERAWYNKGVKRQTGANNLSPMRSWVK